MSSRSVLTGWEHLAHRKHSRCHNCVLHGRKRRRDRKDVEPRPGRQQYAKATHAKWMTPPCAESSLINFPHPPQSTSPTSSGSSSPLSSSCVAAVGGCQPDASDVEASAWESGSECAPANGVAAGSPITVPLLSSSILLLYTRPVQKKVLSCPQHPRQCTREFSLVLEAAVTTSDTRRIGTL